MEQNQQKLLSFRNLFSSGNRNQSKVEFRKVAANSAMSFEMTGDTVPEAAVADRYDST